MTGNQDKTTSRASKRAGVVRAVDMMIEHALSTMAATRLEPGNTLAVQRYMRAAEQITKSQRAVDTLAGAEASPAVDPEAAEDDMADDDDDSPEIMDRVHSQLQSNLDYSRATLERKRMEGWTVVGADARGPEGDAKAA
jgi:hypothetical protein